MTNVRENVDGGNAPPGLNARPYLSELFIDDATGFVSAATPSAEVVDAAPVALGENNGWTQAIATGRLTQVDRPGRYEVELSIGDILSGNASVVTAEVFKNGAVIATAAASLGGAIKAKMTFAAAAVQMAAACSGFVVLVDGDFLDVRVTGSVGTVTIKNMRFRVCQVTDSLQ